MSISKGLTQLFVARQCLVGIFGFQWKYYRRLSLQLS